MKQCIKCGMTKELNGFYIHEGMRDRHLNKCKDCCKKESKERLNALSKFNEWVEKEKERNREKYRRLGYGEKFKTAPTIKKRSIENYHHRYPEKRKALLLSQNLPVSSPGYVKHHWSYNLRHVKDVIELTPSDHYLLHRHILYDQETFMYKRKDTMDLLDTKEKHLSFWKLVSSRYSQALAG